MQPLQTVTCDCKKQNKKKTVLTNEFKLPAMATFLFIISVGFWHFSFLSGFEESINLLTFLCFLCCLVSANFLSLNSL